MQVIINILSLLLVIVPVILIGVYSKNRKYKTQKKFKPKDVQIYFYDTDMFLGD